MLALLSPRSLSMHQEYQHFDPIPASSTNASSIIRAPSVVAGRVHLQARWQLLQARLCITLGLWSGKLAACPEVADRPWRFHLVQPITFEDCRASTLFWTVHPVNRSDHLLRIPFFQEEKSKLTAWSDKPAKHQRSTTNVGVLYQWQRSSIKTEHLAWLKSLKLSIKYCTTTNFVVLFHAQRLCVLVRSYACKAALLTAQILCPGSHKCQNL